MRNSAEAGADAGLVTASHQVLSGVGVAEHCERHVSREAVGRLHWRQHEMSVWLEAWRDTSGRAADPTRIALTSCSSAVLVRSDRRYRCTPQLFKAILRSWYSVEYVTAAVTDI